MDPTKLGTVAERAAIKELLQDDKFRKSQTYRNALVHMCNSAAQDAFYHCSLLVKCLEKSKFDNLKKLRLPPFKRDQNQELSIPSLAFVVTKIYKTFDTKLGKLGCGVPNASHSHDWIREVHNLSDNISDPGHSTQYQFLPSTRTYHKLTDADIAYMNSFVMDIINSDAEDTA